MLTSETLLFVICAHGRFPQQTHSQISLSTNVAFFDIWGWGAFWQAGGSGTLGQAGSPNAMEALIPAGGVFRDVSRPPPSHPSGRHTHIAFACMYMLYII